MISKRTQMITVAISTLFSMIFMLGLTESITAGFADFNAGVPFGMVALTIMAMELFDFYDATVYNSKD